MIFLDENQAHSKNETMKLSQFNENHVLPCRCLACENFGRVIERESGFRKGMNRSDKRLLSGVNF